MTDMLSRHSGELAWGRAFRSKVDEAAAWAGDLDSAHFGRAPSRLWLMEADELENLPIADFIVAFGVPANVANWLTQPRQAQARPRHAEAHPSFAGDAPRGTGHPPVAAPERPRHRTSPSHSPPNTSWSFRVRAYAAAVAAIAFLTG